MNRKKAISVCMVAVLASGCAALGATNTITKETTVLDSYGNPRTTVITEQVSNGVLRERERGMRLIEAAEAEKAKWDALSRAMPPQLDPEHITRLSATGQSEYFRAFVTAGYAAIGLRQAEGLDPEITSPVQATRDLAVTEATKWTDVLKEGLRSSLGYVIGVGIADKLGIIDMGAGFDSYYPVGGGSKGGVSMVQNGARTKGGGGGEGAGGNSVANDQVMQYIANANVFNAEGGSSITQPKATLRGHVADQQTHDQSVQDTGCAPGAVTDGTVNSGECGNAGNQSSDRTIGFN